MEHWGQNRNQATLSQCHPIGASQRTANLADWGAAIIEHHAGKGMISMNIAPDSGSLPGQVKPSP